MEDHEARDQLIILSLIAKIAIARYLVHTETLRLIPFTAVWTVYFALAAALTIYLQLNSQFLLVTSKWSRKDLLRQANASAFDLLFLLPVSVIVAERFNLQLLLTKQDEITIFYSSPVAWLKIPLGMFIGLICRMFVHRVLHMPQFYKSIHKMHHIVPERMTPFSTFNDHPIEFILMEVIGTFLLPCIIQPLPACVLGAVWCFQCIQGVCDHANAVIPGSFFVDSEYHLIHHTVSKRSCNLLHFDIFCAYMLYCQ